MKTIKFKNILRVATLTLATTSFAAVPTLKMGVYLPMSGDTASFGEESRNGVVLALEEINAKKEAHIDMVLEDEKSDVTESANAAKKLLTIDKVNILVGSVASSNTNAAAPIAQAAKIPLMTPASTNITVTQKGEYISRICFMDDFQGYAMAKFAFETLKAKKAAVITDSNSDYSMGLAKSFKEAFSKLGGQIVVEVSYTQKDQDFSSQLTKVKLKKPDAIFVPGYYNNVGTMIRQAKTLGVRAPFLGGDGWSSGTKIFEIAGDAIVGNYYSDHFSPEDTDPKVQEFVKKYKAKYNSEPGAMAALGYDAVYVVADAFKRNGYKTNAEGLMKAINSTKDFKGVTGSITLDKNRNASKPLVILETQKNRAAFKQRVAP